MLTKAKRAYVNWMALDQADRCMTRTEFAELLGVSVSALDKWAADDEFKTALRQRKDSIADSDDYAAVCMRERTKNQLYAEFLKLSKKATKNPQEHQQLRGYMTQLMELTSHVERTDSTVDFSELSDDDLLSLCMKWEVSPAAMTPAELRRAKEKMEENRWTKRSSSYQPSAGPRSPQERLGSAGQPETDSDSPEAKSPPPSSTAEPSPRRSKPPTQARTSESPPGDTDT